MAAARISNKRADWTSLADIPSAVSLIEAAAVTGDQSDETLEAASFLWRDSTTATPSVKKLAWSALTNFGSFQGDEDPDAHYQIRYYKSRLTDNPRDAISWIDIARLYSSIGQNNQAASAISIALKLRGEDRFVVRSAVRFYVHIGLNDSAHDTLIRCASTKHDPWLNAAELAAANLLNKAPKYVKTARSFLDGGKHSDRDLSELAGALATLELENGKAIQAKRLFRFSLRSPNDNSLAQARWAAENYKVGTVESSLIDAVPRSFEAATWQAFKEGLWEKAFHQSEYWAKDEPFSSGPACHASFLAISMLGRYEEGERIAKAGLLANPHEFTLKNNLIVAYAYQNRILDALKVFEEIEWTDADEVHRLAALGLLAARQGEIQVSLVHYCAAIGLATERKDPVSAGRAAFHLFKELIAWDPASSDRVLRLADYVLTKIRNPEMESYRQMVKSGRNISLNPNVQQSLNAKQRGVLVDSISDVMENAVRDKLKVSLGPI